MRQIHFLTEHEERTLIRETRRGARPQLALGLLLLAGCLATGWIQATTMGLVWLCVFTLAFFMGIGLVFSAITELIWVHRREAKLKRELS
jgi:hypothetical protein